MHWGMPRRRLCVPLPTLRELGVVGLLGALAASGGNVMHVSHVRTAVDLAVDEVEIEAQVETRGRDHCTEVLAHLRDLGYRVTEG